MVGRWTTGGRVPYLLSSPWCFLLPTCPPPPKKKNCLASWPSLCHRHHCCGDPSVNLPVALLSLEEFRRSKTCVCVNIHRAGWSKQGSERLLKKKRKPATWYVVGVETWWWLWLWLYIFLWCWLLCVRLMLGLWVRGWGFVEDPVGFE